MRKLRRGWLFPVRNPDIFHLVSVLQTPSAFGLRSLQQVNLEAFIRPDLLQVADGEGLGGGGKSVTPDGVEIGIAT